MHKFLTGFGFTRIDSMTWRKQDGVDLLVRKELIGADEFVRLLDGLGNIVYWTAHTLGLNWDEFAAAISRAERKQRG